LFSIFSISVLFKVLSGEITAEEAATNIGETFAKPVEFAQGALGDD